MLRLSLGLTLILCVLSPKSAKADAFDNYTNKILAKVPESKSAEKITKLTPALMVEHRRVLPGISGCFIVVKTNDGRFAKLLVHPAFHKVSDKELLPTIQFERYVTFNEAEERKVHASGKNVTLFGGFRFNLDIGQVVPESVGADLRLVVDKDDSYLEPVGKAEMYLVTKHLPEANPPKTGKVVVGEKFEMRYFNGAYKLFNDGKRSGTLHLKVTDEGKVSGHYFSDQDGAKYEVTGEISKNPKHQIEFLITYPATSQVFTGLLFTGDAKAITGSTHLQGQTLETGFYALRIEDEK